MWNLCKCRCCLIIEVTVIRLQMSCEQDQWMCNRQSAPNCRNIKLRHRRITHKKDYIVYLILLIYLRLTLGYVSQIFSGPTFIEHSKFLVTFYCVAMYWYSAKLLVIFCEYKEIRKVLGTDWFVGRFADCASQHNLSN